MTENCVPSDLRRVRMMLAAMLFGRPVGDVHGRGPPAVPGRTAFLGGRFAAYRRTSDVVMALLRELSPLVEPASLDEAYVDLAAGQGHDLSVEGVTAIGRALKERIAKATGGVTGSVGIGSSKMLAKIGSDLQKPDGLVVVPPGTSSTCCTRCRSPGSGGVGPATAERLHQVGVKTVADLAGSR